MSSVIQEVPDVVSHREVRFMSAEAVCRRPYNLNERGHAMMKRNITGRKGVKSEIATGIFKRLCKNIVETQVLKCCINILNAGDSVNPTGRN